MPFQRQTPRNSYEQAVQEAGYPWVDTVYLKPYSENDVTGPPYNRLNTHVHQSANTHLIVKGRLELMFDSDSMLVLDASTTNPREAEASVTAGTWYMGRAGPDGATFVEGHSILSPATAERLERRQALLWIDDGSGQTREQWFAEERRRGATRRYPLRSEHPRIRFANGRIYLIPICGSPWTPQ